MIERIIFDIDLFLTIQEFRIYARHEVGYSSVLFCQNSAVQKLGSF